MFISHYIEIKNTRIGVFLKKDIRDIYRNFHGYVGKCEGKIGVSFPEWSEKDIGNSIRFFGRKEELQFISDTDWLSQWNEKSFIDLGRIREIPKIVYWVRFYRNRKQEKEFGEKYFDRIQKRKWSYYAKNHIAWKASQKQENTRYTAQVSHYFTLQSESTKQERFSVNILREEHKEGYVWDSSLRFSSFGLGQSGLRVPEF